MEVAQEIKYYVLDFLDGEEAEGLLRCDFNGETQKCVITTEENKITITIKRRELHNGDTT